tara:strand:- start:12083 stop:13147 length:1065 start_codon:yes stop_codon:yes gene_type:complete
MNLLKIIFNLSLIFQHTFSGGIHDQNNCNPCMPIPPCPPPGPDCIYLDPEYDECGCIYGCGEIMCNPSPQICPDVMCMVNCENGQQIDENGCHTCLCNSGSNSNTEEVCPIKEKACNNAYVCPKITEITHCSEGGIQGTTTYQLSLVLQNQNIQNIYAIFGDKIENNQRLIIPGAYQLQGPFRSNVGGISSDILSLSPNARFDSWLTIGITDGDPNNQLGAIGIDFDSWNLNNPLIVDNGAIFVMDPDYNLHGITEVIIGQLTMPSQISAEAIINVEGKILYEDEPWKELNIVFSISPPLSDEAQNDYIPNHCILWYDGCNTCSVLNGEINICTHNLCFMDGESRCLSFDQSGH